MRLVLTPLIIFFSIQVIAQTNAPLRFERIGGLSQNTVYSIAKDRQGFLWVATGNGLNRYDGEEMKVYKPSLGNMPEQMTGRVIRSAIMEDRNDQLWFSTDMVLHTLEKKSGSIKTYPLVTAEKAGSGQQSIFANPLWSTGDTLWCANADKGLFAFNTRTKQSVNFPLLQKDEKGNAIRLMYNGVYDQKEGLWFASSNGLFGFNLRTRQWQHFMNGHVLYAVAFCRDTLYISEGKELYWFLPHNKGQSGKVGYVSSSSEQERDLIHCIYTDNKATIWVGDEKGNVYAKYSDSNALEWMGNINGQTNPRTYYPVYCFYSDTSGTLWAGAYMLGLLKAQLERPGFSVYPEPRENKTTSTVFVNSIYEDEQEMVWLGTFQQGLLLLNKRTGIATPVNLPYHGPPVAYGNSVRLIQADSYGNLWTSMHGCFFIREKGRSSFTAIKVPIPSNALESPQLWSLCEYKGGWIAGTNIGLFYIEKWDGNYTIQHLSRFGQKRVTGLWVNQDSIWIAFESGGGVVITTGIGQQDTQQVLFTKTNVRSFLPDSTRQLVWLCTSDGLIAYHLPSKKSALFSEAEGLPNSYTFGAIREGSDLWISTNNGLAKGKVYFNSGTVLPVISFTNFTTDNGLPDNVFNPGAFHRGQSGTYYFGTAKGLTWFKPGETKISNNPSRLHMIDLLVNDQQATDTLAPEYITHLRLPYDRNSLFFRFRNISFSGEKPLYTYQLEGWDKDWISGRQLNEARYSNLPHGHYVFKVKALNSGNVAESGLYTITIDIIPPFWKTWWFYWLIILTGLIILVFVTRYYAQQKLKHKVAALERQQEIDRERQRISREMHDDIGVGLTQITMLSESAKNNLHSADRKPLDDIAEIGRQLVNSMGEIIWSLNTENKTLEQLMAHLREQLNQQLEYSHIAYSVVLPETGGEVQLNNQQWRNIFLVTKEVVNNAIRHSAADCITIKANFAEGAFVCSVKDNGKGFDPQAAYKGNGLKNIKQRIQEIGGVLDVLSVPGQGSEFIYSVRLIH